ncbi:MAG TPA: IPT/TIG domain-containing protein [Thermoanaerobaculia bacterium]
MNRSRFARSLALTAVLLAAWGCTSDSPTEPTQPPVNPIPPVPVTTFNVTVTASPPQLTAGASEGSAVTVRVVRSDTGQPPPDLTEVVLTTSLGSFNSVGSGVQTVTLQLVNGQAQAVLFPGADVGTATVRAQVGSSAGVTNVSIQGPATFFVGSLSPGVGDPAGGEEVILRGGGFDGPVRVTFGGATAQVLSVSPTQIRVRTPSAAAAGVNPGIGESAQVDVAVTINLNETGQATDNLARGFTFAHGGGPIQQPQVFSVSPASGTNDGGTRVTLLGSGFQAPVQVFFGQGTAADNFTGVEATVEAVTSSQIIVVTPPARGFGQDNVNQNVDILVKNVQTGFSTIRSDAFRYGSRVIITAFGPGVGPATGGTIVTISGQGFDEPVAVSFGGIGQQVISVTGTEIVIRTVGVLVTQCPASGFIEARGVRVVNIETGDFDDEPDLVFQYTVPRPVIFGISPISGNVGTLATVTGAGFAANVQVLFGGPTGSAAQILSKSATSIGIRVPTPPQDFTFATEPCDGNGDGIAGGTRNIPTPITIVVRNLDDAQCTATLTNGFTLTPQNTTCTGDTSTPPPPPVVQCNDGFDNDGDTFIDALDPQCTGPTDNSESS